MQTLSNYYNNAKLIGTEQYYHELIAVIEENKLLKQLKVAEEE